MMESYTLKKAELNQLPAAMELINDGKQYLKEQGSDQWQTGYPDEADILEDIRQGKGYFVTDGTQPLAYLCVDFEGEPAYAQTKGNWLTDGSSSGVVHRLPPGRHAAEKGLPRPSSLWRSRCAEAAASGACGRTPMRRTGSCSTSLRKTAFASAGPSGSPAATS